MSRWWHGLHSKSWAPQQERANPFRLKIQCTQNPERSQTNYPVPLEPVKGGFGVCQCVALSLYALYRLSLSLSLAIFFIYQKKQTAGWLQKLLDYPSRAAMPGDPEGALEKLPKWRKREMRGKSRRVREDWDGKKMHPILLGWNFFQDMEADGTYKQKLWDYRSSILYTHKPMGAHKWWGLRFVLRNRRKPGASAAVAWTDKYYTGYRLEGNDVIGFPSFHFSAFASITFAIISSGIYNHINQVHVAEYNRLFQIVKVLYCCQAYIIIIQHTYKVS